MSRALDEESVQALKASAAPLQIYGDISSLLVGDNASGEGLLEIEFLGKAHVLPAGTTFLRDGVSVAIPKRNLVQAFVVARQVLFRQTPSSSSSSSSTHGFLGGAELLAAAEAEAQLDAATAVLLLMDPEHLTAANARKRALLRCSSSAAAAAPPVPGGGGSAEQQREAAPASSTLAGRVARERRLVDSLLTSPLHRHAKSPILWAHRRWLLRQQEAWRRQRRRKGDGRTEEEAAQGDDGAEDVGAHLQNVVMVAAERHPRNYYAWNHARWLVDQYLSGDDPRLLGGGSGEHSLTQLAVAVKDWCLRHHTDTSGWSFLYFLIMKSEKNGGNHLLASEIFLEILGLAKSLAWVNESVWVFLRVLAASPCIREEDRDQFEKVCDALVGSTVLSTKTVQAARNWGEGHRQKPSV